MDVVYRVSTLGGQPKLFSARALKMSDKQVILEHWFLEFGGQRVPVSRVYTTPQAAWEAYMEEVETGQRVARDRLALIERWLATARDRLAAALAGVGEGATMLEVRKR